MAAGLFELRKDPITGWWVATVIGSLRSSKRPATILRPGQRRAKSGGECGKHRKGHALHDSLRDLAAKLIPFGRRRRQRRQPVAGDDAGRRGAARRAAGRRSSIDIRIWSSAEAKFRQPDPEPAVLNAAPRAIDETLAVFDRWLILHDKTPIYAVLGTVAATCCRAIRYGLA